MSTITAKVRENPVVSLVSAVVLLGALITGTVQGIDTLDSLVMTEAEHFADTAPLKIAMEDMQSWNKCARIERKMDTLEDRVFNLKQNSGSTNEIHNVESDHRKLERRYVALGCARILAWNPTVGAKPHQLS